MVQEEQATSTTETETKMDTSSPVKSTPTASDTEELLKRAQNAQFQGKRNFLMKDTASACAALEDACRLLVEIYGPLAKEHAEAHFFYGKALLEQARLDLAVFDAPGGGGGGADAKSGDDDDDDEDEDDEEEEDDEAEKTADGNEVKSSSNAEQESPKESTEPLEKSINIETTLTHDEDINEPSPSNAVAATAASSSAGSSSGGSKNFPIDNDVQPSTSKGVTAPVDEDKAVEDELNNLELAWEVFEIAKIDYSKHIEELEGKLLRASDDEITPEDRIVQRKQLCDLKRKLAETHSLLGEVGTESEIYPQAIEDFKTALSMYSELESPDSREIAQVHFHIGLAYGLEKNFKESVESLNSSVEIIRKRIENLKKQITESTTDEDFKGSLVKEVQELTELLPELQEKINDTLEQERDAKRVEEEEKMEQEIIQRNSPVKNPNPPAANDISHLVKKRKKIELEPAPLNAASNLVSDVEPPSKKVCTSVSFDTPTNGHSATTVANDAPATTE